MTDNDNSRKVEVDAARLERLIVALERLVSAEERKLAQAADNERRALQKAGPTTAKALTDVKAKLRARGAR